MQASLPSPGCPGISDNVSSLKDKVLLVPAEPEVSERSCFIWPGSLSVALYSPCSLTGVDLVGEEGWCLSVTLPGEGQERGGEVKQP